MKVPIEVQCTLCTQVFCCGRCRLRHEYNAHQELLAIRQICYICNGKPFPLHKDTKVTPSNLLLKHIFLEHLPLRCNRCAKVFQRETDFSFINRCLVKCVSAASDEGACRLESNPVISTILETEIANAECSSAESLLENKENVNDMNQNNFPLICPSESVKAASSGKNSLTEDADSVIEEEKSETGDEQQPTDAPMLTPLSMINLRWKQKSRQSFDSTFCTTTNLSAVVNASSTSAAGEIISTASVSASAVTAARSPGKKLFRTTSTPMMHSGLMTSMMLEYHTKTATSSSSLLMSSIHCQSQPLGITTLGSEEDVSRNATGQQQDVSKLVTGLLRSQSGKARRSHQQHTRRKVAVAATPLRQVMSKSIQRAIAEYQHQQLQQQQQEKGGGYYSRMLTAGTQRKMTFSSTGSSSSGGSSSGYSYSSSVSSELGESFDVTSASQAAILDLRTTPVLKRSSTCGGNDDGPRPPKSPKEDGSTFVPLGVEASSLADANFFDTHQNVDSLMQDRKTFTDDDVMDQENRDNHAKAEAAVTVCRLQRTNSAPCCASSYQDTPRIAGGLLKKVISFTTPSSIDESSSKARRREWGEPTGTLFSDATKASVAISTTRQNVDDDDDDDDNSGVGDDVWSTPSSIPPSSVERRRFYHRNSISCSMLNETTDYESTLSPVKYKSGDTSSSLDDVFSASNPRKVFGENHAFSEEEPSSCGESKDGGFVASKFRGRSGTTGSSVGHNSGRLWTIVSNVIRLASRSDLEEDSAAAHSVSPASKTVVRQFGSCLAQKAASFAGFLKNRLPSGGGSGGSSSSTPVSDQQPPQVAVRRPAIRSSEGFESASTLERTKRQRVISTTTVYPRTTANASRSVFSSPLAKRKRIQGRQPLERMRRQRHVCESSIDNDHD